MIDNFIKRLSDKLIENRTKIRTKDIPLKNRMKIVRDMGMSMNTSDDFENLFGLLKTYN